MDTATDTDLSCLKTQQERRWWMAGSETPSPTPIRTRTSRRRPKLCSAAAGVRRVKIDQKNTAAASTGFDPTRPATRPPAICVRMYPQKKLLMMYPCCTGV